jgi:4-diphosphocytidyl-2-C-methyl-D-erythritol kinase
MPGSSDPASAADSSAHISADVGAEASREAAISWWPAPAKLNLFLHITGRYADGYHALQTIFQLIDRCDRIGLALREDGRIERRAGLAEVPPEADLSVRAARLLQQRVGSHFGADIHVLKHIPAGGGLGGGSSDAATVLLALNQLWRTGLDLDTLAGVGLSLGADVPVFIRGHSAWGEGRGERLVPVQLPPRWYLVVHPPVTVSTAEVFQAPELTRNSPVITIRGLSMDEVNAGTPAGTNAPGAVSAAAREEALAALSVAAGGAGTSNVCEPVVRARYPAVAEALDWLSGQLDGQGRPVAARMTGTGSCIFAAFERWQEAERVAARVPDRWSSFVARGLPRSPLHAILSPAS